MIKQRFIQEEVFIVKTPGEPLYEYKKDDFLIGYVLTETTEFFYIVDKFGIVAQLSPGQ